MALDLAEVPEEIRAELASTAEIMADGKFLIVGRFQFSDKRIIEGGGCPEAFVNYIQSIDVFLTVEAGGWFYTRNAIDSYYAEDGNLQIRALGHQPVDLPLTVDADIILVDEILLIPETEYAIEGTVRDAAGEPQQGIVVDLRFPLSNNCWGPLATTRTDEAGRYAFHDLSCAEHRVILGAPFGFVYVTTDIVPQSTEAAEVVDFVLQSKLQMVLDYAYQPDGSRTLFGPNLVTGTITWPAEGMGLDFEDGHLEGYESEDLRDLDLLQEADSLYVRCVYQTGSNGFYRLTDTRRLMR